MTNCDIRIWHTLAEVVCQIKLFLNCCCSIDVLYYFAHFFFLFCDLFFNLCIKIFICCYVC